MSIISLEAFSQGAPHSFNYAGVARDAQGQVVANQSIALQIEILEGNPSGNSVYSETHSAVTNELGFFTLIIGSGVVQSGDFDQINWGLSSHFLGISLDITGGQNFTLMGTSQLLSVPYALYAESSGSVANPSGETHFIGEEFGGGVIYYLWHDSDNSQHGLIVDLVDLSDTCIWSNAEGVIGQSVRSAFDGVSNCNEIINQLGHTFSAAKLCLDSENGGYTDWYLPSTNELQLLWSNYTSVAKRLSEIPGASPLKPSCYWTSTEMPSPFGELETASYFSFLNGSMNYDYHISYLYYKLSQLPVRAIRSF